MTPGIAVFDLDRTVTRAATFTPFLFHCAGALGRSRAGMVLAALPVLTGYGLGLKTRGEAKAGMLACSIAGQERAAVARWARDFAGGWLTARVRPGARAAIARHRAAGDRLVMATAAFDFHARPFAEALGFDHLIATASVWDQAQGRDVLRPALGGDNCHGAAKLAAVRAYAGQARVAAAYSDHHSDYELLRWADKGVAVNPTGRLRALSRAHGLGVEDWN
ncbi:MAG: HAD-IB family hydrolase [Rhodospirillaceae bacterium]|nr:HAD-IB family hydrolase [Rhodospirillaceae bacterium]